MKGQPIWTDAEDELCRKYHPDYKALMKVLKRRSYYACRSHCQKLGLVPKRHLWSALDRMKLRKLYPASSREELLEAFPGLRYDQIAQAARYYRVQRKPKPYKPTGFAPLDQVRDKCFELKLTMPDLDAMCRTKNYFSKNGWRGWNKVVSYRKLVRAIKALDGEVQIDWND